MSQLWVPPSRFPPNRERNGSGGNDGADSPAWRNVDLAALVDKYDLVEVTDDAVVVVQRPPAWKLADVPTEPDMRELGVQSASSFLAYSRQDYNPRLRGHQGLRVFDEMRRSNAQIHMALTLYKIPVLAARWYIEPASPSKKDKKIAEFVWKNLTMQLSNSWPLFLTEILLHLDFGWYAFEEVYEIVDGMTRWKKFMPLHPLDAPEDPWDYDAAGGPVGLKWPLENNAMQTIPITKMLAFTHQKEGGNMQGISALRPMYMHWFFINNFYKIDAIQKERHGVGIPVIVLPANFTPTDKLRAHEMGRNLRTNEKAHIVLPPMWEIKMLELQGHQVDILASVEHHNNMIANAVLAPLSGRISSPSEADVVSDLYLKATRVTADVIRDAFNKWSIPRLVRWNWGSTAADNPPELKVRRIGETVDWRTLSFTYRNLVGAQLLYPDKPLLDAMRTEFDLPEVDEATMMQALAPQAPGGGYQVPPDQVPSDQAPKGQLKPNKVPSDQVPTQSRQGQPPMPRQSQARNQRIMPSRAAGRDGSGRAQGN